jgi:hypothetical protein
MIPPATEKQFVQTTHGNIADLKATTQEEPPVPFVYGIPWRHVLSFLQDDLPCYAPDLMELAIREPLPRPASSAWTPRPGRWSSS